MKKVLTLVIVLAFSIVDPSSNKPSVRFANKNYFKGGYHPVGKIGIGAQNHIDDASLQGIDFYVNPKHDEIKSYIYPFGIDDSLDY